MTKEEAGVLACGHVRILACTWTLGAYTLERYLARSHKDRIPKGVFGVASLALYASALSHDFGQMLGCPAPVFGRLTFRSIG